MKRILFTLAVSVFAVAGMAQTGQKLHDNMPQTIHQPKSFEIEGQKKDINALFEWPQNLDDLGVGGDVLSAYMHPDSLKVEYSDGWGTAYAASVGAILDVKSQFWSGTDGNGNTREPVHPADTFTINSVVFTGAYQRTQTANPDTLRMWLIDHGNIFDGTFGSGDPFKGVLYDSITNGPPVGTYVSSHDIILNDADTSWAFYRTFTWDNLNWTNLPGDLAGAVVSFIPGNPYTIDDTLNSQTPSSNLKNRFIAQIYDDGAQTEDADYWNDGLLIQMDQRYNVSQLGWNGQYLPGSAFLSLTRLVGIGFEVEVKGTISGVEDLEAAAGLFVTDVYPNPAVNQATIKYSVNRSTNIQFEMRDITGKVVFSENQGVKGRDVHTLNVNTSNLKSGVYFYSIISDTEVVTDKLSVVK